MVLKSIRSINICKRDFAEGDYDFACSRAYYAVFYLLEAALLTKGLVYSSHGSVLGYFNKNFVKAGYFPGEFSKIINQLFKNRQVADYEFIIKFGKSEAQKNIEDSEMVMKEIITYLVNEKFIDPVSGF